MALNWSVLQTSPVRLLLLWVWLSPGLHLGHALVEPRHREDGACVVGGRTIVSWGCPFRVSVAYFSASPAVFSASFVLSPLFFFFCRHWSHQCWGLNCCHSTQLNHLVCNGGSALYPLLWGMGAWPVYGSFQLTGLGVCLLGCQVKLERSLKGFALRHSHPTFYRKIPPFLQP